MGIAEAGFRHLALIEIDRQACETIRQNQANGHKLVQDWPLYAMDIREFDFSTVESNVDLLAAGVPCQPFSVGGRCLADRDSRDMFSEVIRAAERLRPKTILIENVRGLLRSRLREYLRYLTLAISSPTIARLHTTDWHDQMVYLRKHATTGDLNYRVHILRINAADFGVPQYRERVLIVAFRSDIRKEWIPPKKTNGLDALVWAQCKTGSYWEKHGLGNRQSSLIGRRVTTRMRSLRESISPVETSLSPWRTVRDAIYGLPDPKPGGGAGNIPNHELKPGARPYKGHSGSILDEPAKTLKAGNHGVPGGENSLVLDSGEFRYFSVRECARLQTFPDDYVFSGSWSSSMRQVGNAVPVSLARVIAASIGKYLMD